MSSQRPNTCIICLQHATGYNYKVPCCNACKMFFKRCTAENVEYTCLEDKRCFDDNVPIATRRRCRACRFEKCLRVGMENVNDTDKSGTLSVIPKKSLVVQEQVDCTVIQNLLEMHTIRRSVYAVINICEDPSFMDLVVQGPMLAEYMRPRNIDWSTTARKLKPWVSMGVLITAEICKTLDFYNELLLSDRILLLKNVAFKSYHLSVAFDSFSRKKGKVLTPFDQEMVPIAFSVNSKCDKVITELYTSVIESLIEHTITEQEFLLINMIIICNPGIEGLSPGGQKSLSTYQRRYAKLLLNLCMIKNTKLGPSRFAALLAINDKLDKQVFITQKLDFVLRAHWDPTYYFPKIMFESCRMDKCKWINQ